MRQWIYAVATTLSLAAFGALAPAQALPVQTGIAVPSDVQQAQFVFGGRNYCFYPNGWNGPGFYWCGYAFRRGLGWGGGHGWHGWDHRRPPHAHGGHGHRPHMGGRPGGSRPHASGRPGGGRSGTYPSAYGSGRGGGGGGGHGHRR
jgi:hypothetical protein